MDGGIPGRRSPATAVASAGAAPRTGRGLADRSAAGGLSGQAPARGLLRLTAVLRRVHHSPRTSPDGEDGAGPSADGLDGVAGLTGVTPASCGVAVLPSGTDAVPAAAGTGLVAYLPRRQQAQAGRKPARRASSKRLRLAPPWRAGAPAKEKTPCQAGSGPHGAGVPNAVQTKLPPPSSPAKLGRLTRLGARQAWCPRHPACPTERQTPVPSPEPQGASWPFLLAPQRSSLEPSRRRQIQTARRNGRELAPERQSRPCAARRCRQRCRQASPFGQEQALPSPLVPVASPPWRLQAFPAKDACRAQPQDQLRLPAGTSPLQRGRLANLRPRRALASRP